MMAGPRNGPWHAGSVIFTWSARCATSEKRWAGEYRLPGDQTDHPAYERYNDELRWHEVSTLM